MHKLYLLLNIVKRSDLKEYRGFFEKNGVSVIYDTLANGTAHEKTLSLLGLERNEKAILISLITYPSLKKILRRLEVEMQIDLPDRGIAVAVPLSSIGGTKSLEYFKEGQDIPKELENNVNGKGETDNMQTVQELILAIYEKGYTDLVMDAAREAGARGGTTIRAKGTSAGAQKFFGITLADEKEILLIVTSTSQKNNIMKAIMQKAGMDSKAHSIVFSLPVTDTAGFRFTDEVEKD